MKYQAGGEYQYSPLRGPATKMSRTNGSYGPSRGVRPLNGRDINSQGLPSSYFRNVCVGPSGSELFSASGSPSRVRIQQFGSWQEIVMFLGRPYLKWQFGWKRRCPSPSRCGLFHGRDRRPKYEPYCFSSGSGTGAVVRVLYYYAGENALSAPRFLRFDAKVTRLEFLHPCRQLEVEFGFKANKLSSSEQLDMEHRLSCVYCNTLYTLHSTS